MEESELQHTEARATNPFAWFALGSLFGALMLATSAMLASRGDVLQVFGPSADAQRMSLYKQAAREAMLEVLAESQDANPAGTTGQPNPPAAALGPSQIVVRAANTRGDPNAPVILIEYSDFQCPYCLRHHNETSPQIIEQYVNTGKVKITFKEFPALGPASVVAAMAAECAADQSAFIDYSEALWSYRNANGRVPQTKDELIKVGAGLNKLNMTTFAGCVNNGSTALRVQDDADEAQRIGARGTPTFIINGRMIVGAQPYAVFKAAIDEALKKQG